MEIDMKCYNCGKECFEGKDSQPIGILRYDSGDESVGLAPDLYIECIECFNEGKKHKMGDD